MTTATPTSPYERLKEAIAKDLPAAVATVVRGAGIGNKLVILPDETVGTLGSPELDAQVVADARALLNDERSETRTYTIGEDERDVFIETFPPPPLLLIFGAVHVAQALTKFAKLLGFKVIVSDARSKLASRERFPEADEIIVAWPDETLETLKIEPNTYIAILTHDPKFDEPAILGSLKTRARYIGAVGSRRTNADRRERLRAAGVDEESLARVRGPIGLDIGASTPEEMAISILAEIIATRHGRTGGPLTQATGNIRARV
ncbi:MAG TPA: XdhC/CoxI family protein [Thermomicrobiales bacterium]